MKAFLPLLVALLSAGLAHAQAVPPEVKVGGKNLIDYEFDWGRDGSYCPTCNHGQGNNRFAFVDPLDKNVYIGRIDADTGFFYPPDGHGWLVDGNAVTATQIGNGPEWVVSQRGSELTYTRWLDGTSHNNPRTQSSVGYAYLSSIGWIGASLPDTQGKVLPIGSMNINDPAPMLSFQNYGNGTTTNVFWEIESPGTAQHQIELNSSAAGVTRRWVPGTTKMLMTYPDAANVRQVYLYDTKTSAATQLTSDAAQKYWAFMWQAPEYPGEYLFFAQVGQTEIDVYRHDPGAPTWHVINKIMMPAATPYVSSPEPFVHNGKSWLMFQLTSTQNPQDYTTTSHVAIVGITAGEQVKVLTNDETNQFVRRDPEYYITSKGPFVYYNVYAKNTDPSANPQSLGVYRVDTGLGAPVAQQAPGGR